MDAATITQIVSTVGFPIAFCLLMYLDNKKKVETLTEAVNNNTLVMTKLVERMCDKNNG